MAKFYTRLRKLLKLLKEDDRLTDQNGELIRAAITDRAWKLDPKLVKTLLRDEEIKRTFFQEIYGHWIFNANAFIDYIGDIKFLDNSYTRFRNKIGINIDGKFLRERGEVTLAWPYKDCVLEGGQTKDDEKRKELFFNETLARDEIGRMFAPKALTSWRRHSADAAENGRVGNLKRDADSVLRENMLIKGNNLIVLHSLATQFRGKVKLIYIDPMYNTGSDSFGYNNNFLHSSWMTFMRNRLIIARELLSDNGIIFVQCDDNEHSYLKVVMDEIFGRKNLISNSVIVTNRGGRDYGGIAKTHEYILIYSRYLDTDLNQLEETDKLFDYTDDIGGFNLMELRNRNILFNDATNPSLCYPFYVDPNSHDRNDLLNIYLEPKSGLVKVMPLKSQGIQTVWRWGKAKANESLNIELKGKARRGGGYMIVQKYRKTTKRQRSVWDEKEFINERGTKHIKQLFGYRAFPYPKSEHLIKRVIELGSNKGDIVLDYHAGSGTTASAAHKMGRKWIAVEQMDYIEDITVERLKKVLGGEPYGISESVGWKGGGDFLYCELAPYNQSFMDRIQRASSSDELLRVWADMTKNSFLNWYANPENPDNALEDLKAVGEEPDGLEKQKRLLAALLDKSQLYVHKSEIADPDFNISDEDRELTRQFYDDDPDDP